MNEEFDYRKYLNLIVKKRRLFVIVALSIMTGVVIYSYTLPRRYEAKSTVFIEKSVINELVKGIAVTPSLEEKVRLLTYSMKSRTLLLKVVDELDLAGGKTNDAQRERMVRDFQDRTEVKLNDKDGLFVVSFFHENPRFARDYVNTLVRRYIEENTSSKREDSYGATKFLSEQIATVKQKLDQAEAQASTFKSAKGAILAEDPDRILREIDDAQQKIEEISMKRNQLESMQRLIRKNNPLQTKLAALQKKLSELSIVYTDSYPEIVQVKSEIAYVAEQLKTTGGKVESASANDLELEKVAVELSTLRAAEQNQRRIIAAKQSLLHSIPATKASLEELERERVSHKNLYEQLVSRYGQSEFSKQMEVQDKAITFRVVDPAVIPSKATSPNRAKIILMGIVAALVASFALLILIDFLDNSIRSVDAIKSLGVPVLAVVPRIENLQEQQTLKRRDLRFFALSGCYFSLIVAVLSMEALNLDLIGPLKLKQNASQAGAVMPK